MDEDDTDYGPGPGMPPPSVLGLKPAQALPRISDLLLLEATLLMNNADGNSLRLAVILAHAACDVQTEETMAQLLIARDARYLHKPIMAVVGPQISLHIDRVREFYTALSGDTPTKRPWWSKWKDSLGRRNGVAHSGHVVNLDTASQTLSVCREYVQHLKSVTAAHVPEAWVSP